MKTTKTLLPVKISLNQACHQTHSYCSLSEELCKRLTGHVLSIQINKTRRGLRNRNEKSW